VYSGGSADHVIETFEHMYYETGSPFEYELIRLLYGKARQLDISK